MKYSLYLLCLLLSSALSAEEYVIPIFGSGVRGADAAFDSEILITNTSVVPVNARIAEIYPLIDAACANDVECWREPITIPAESYVYLYGPRAVVSDRRLLFGAFLLVTDAPVKIDHNVFRTSRLERAAQSVPTIQGLHSGRVPVIIPKAFHGAGSQNVNLFVVNPNDTVLEVGYSIGYPEQAFFSFDVAPKSTGFRRVQYDPVVLGFGREGVPLSLYATKPFYAVTSDGVVTRPSYELPR